jgi:phosphatidylserine/phosphatidylglycerophosphate/cardiolipin synthase-like enzyme
VNIFTLITLFLLAISSYASEQLIIEPDAGRTPLVNAIKEAKSSIDLVMYGFTDKQLLKALDKAHTLGKEVHILLEPHPYKAEDENNYAIHRLQSDKIDLQWANPEFKLTHQKTFIFDKQRALIMTFNLTYSSFTNERNFGLMTDDPAIVSEIKHVFIADSQRKLIATHNPRLIWSPNQAEEKFLDFINNAHTSIEIYAQDLADFNIIGALAKAAKEGKTVKIIMSEFKNKRPNKKLDFLRRHGVVIHFNRDLIIHAKVIIVDHSRALLGSTNLTYPSMKLNRELSIITEDSTVVKQLMNTFQRDWQP